MYTLSLLYHIMFSYIWFDSTSYCISLYYIDVCMQIMYTDKALKKGKPDIPYVLPSGFMG